MSQLQPLPALEWLEQFKEKNPDLNSVSKILTLREDQFVQAYAKDFDNDVRKARRAYREAQQIELQVTLLWGNIKDVVGSLSIKDALFNNLPEKIPPTFIQHQRSIPGYTQLFGNLDFTESDHCRSIFGPAAYFVDLLRFIEHNIPQNDLPQDHRLDQRQPHIFYMPLDCDNTFTLLPYIDLVTEVLEDVLRAMPPAQPGTQPQDPYQQVAEAIFPPNLPFHLPLEEVRLYLEQLKVNLQDIYRLFGVIDPAMVAELLPLTPSYRAATSEAQEKQLTRHLQTLHELLVAVEPELAREELSLSPQDYTLVKDAIAPTDLAAYYGVPTLTLEGKGSLADVAVFTRQLGLSAEELNTLLFLDLSPNEVQAGLSRLFFINHTGDQQGHLEIQTGDDGGVGDEKFAIAIATVQTSTAVEAIVQALDSERVTSQFITSFQDAFEQAGIELPQNSLTKARAELVYRGRHWRVLDLDNQRTYGVSQSTNQLVIEDALYLRLNKNETPLWLRQAFRDHDITLSDEAKVLVDTADRQWRVWDTNANLGTTKDVSITYIIRRVDNQLVVFDEPYDRLLNLTPYKLDRIYRFLKLARRLDWSYGDLDWALRSLQGSPVAEKVLRFDGINDFVAIPQTEDLTPSTFTLEAWVMMSETGTHPIVAQGTPDRMRFLFWITPLGQLAFLTGAMGANDLSSWQNHPKAQLLTDSNGQKRLNMMGERSIPTGGVTHVAVTVNEAVDLPIDDDGNPDTPPVNTRHYQLKFYINGRLDSTWSLQDSLPFQMPVGEQAINIGRDLASEYFTGQIAEVRLWNVIRSGDELMASRFRRFTGREAGLVGYWPLHETVSLTVPDLTVQHNAQGLPLPTHPGILGGTNHYATPIWALGDLVLDPLPLPLSSYALHFNGRDTFVAGQVPHLNLPIFTLETWFSINGDQHHPLITKGAADQNRVAYRLWLNTNRQISFSTATQDLTSDFVIDEDVLTHVAVVVTPDAAVLLINGRVDKTLPNPAGVATDDADFYLGRDFQDHFLNGTLKEVRIWNIARTDTAIATTMHHQLVGTEPGLVAYWRLDDPLPELERVRDRSLFKAHLYPGGDPSSFQPLPYRSDAPILPDPINRQAPTLTVGPGQYPLRLQNSQPLESGDYAVDLHNSQQRGLGHHEQFTLQFWFNASHTSNEQLLFTQGDFDTGLTFYLQNDKLYVYAWQIGADRQTLGGHYGFESSALDVDQWHSVTFTYDETHRPDIAYRLYVNGVQVNPLTLTNPDGVTFRLDQVGPAYLGGLPAGGFTRFHSSPSAASPAGFSGQITDLRLWNLALTGPDPSNPDLLPSLPVPPELQEHLIAYLPMTENYGRPIYNHQGPAYAEEPPLPVPDQSPNERTAILDVGPDAIEPKWHPVDNLPVFRDRALTLNGVNQFLYLPYASELGIVGQRFTLELWVRPAQAGIDQGVDQPLVGSDGDLFSLSLTQNGQIRLSGDGFAVVSDATLNADTWHHLAWRFDGATHTLFVDGQPNTTPTEAPGIGQDGALYLGQHRQGGATTYFHGDISEVRLWQTARTDRAIAEHWQFCLTGSEADLAAYWVFDYDHRLELRDRTPATHPLRLELAPHQDINTRWVSVAAPPTLNRQSQTLTLNQPAELRSDFPVPDYIDLADLPVSIHDSGTLELWVQFSRATDQVLLDASLPDRPFLVAVQGQILSFRVSDTAGVLTQAEMPLAELATDFDDRVHHIAVTWQFSADAATTQISLYVDELRATATQAGNGLKPAFPGPWIGLNRTRDLAALRPFQGQISQLRVWQGVRSPFDLQRLSHADLEGTEAGLLAYLSIDEGQQIKLTDWVSMNAIRVQAFSIPHPAPTWEIADYALALNGQGDHIQTGFTPGASGSLELWVKFDPTRKQILLDASTDQQRENDPSGETGKAFVIRVLRLGNKPTLQFWIEQTNDADFYAEIDLTSVPPDFSTTWHYIVATWTFNPQQQTTEAHLFLDDRAPVEAVRERNSGRPMTGMVPTFRSLYIGRNRGNYAQVTEGDINPLHGQVRYFGAWNQALSPQQVSLLWRTPWQGIGTDPVISLLLNEDTGNDLNGQATLHLQDDPDVDRWQVVDQAVVINHQETFIAGPPNYVPGSAGTIELWVTFRRDRSQILLDASGEGDNLFVLNVHNSKLRFQIATGIAELDLTPLSDPFDDAWHHLVVTWTYAAAPTPALALGIVLDGTWAQVAQASGLAQFPTLTTLYIGILRQEADHLTDYRTLQGSISQLRIWNRAFSGEADANLLKRRRYTDLTGNELGLLVYLPFNEGSGNALRDGVAGNNATLRYGIFPHVQWGRNPVTLLQWNGNYGVLPSIAVLGLTGTYTLEAWINLADLTGTHPILGTRGPLLNPVEGWVWGIQDGKPWVRIAGQERIATDLTLSADTWHHITCQYDGAGTLRLSVDGQFSAETADNLDPYTVDRTLYLGLWQRWNGTGWDRSHVQGQIAEVRVWSAHRDDLELAQHRDRRLRGDEAHLVAYWPLTDEHRHRLFSVGQNPAWAYLARELQAMDLYSTATQPPLHTPRFAVELDGYNDYLALNYILDPNTPHTVEFWYLGRADQWQHLAVVYGNGPRQLFLNGVATTPTPEQENKLLAYRLNSSPTDRPPRQINGQYEVATGSMTDLRLWSTARPAAAIQADYQRYLSGREEHLLAYWKVDEGNGDRLMDSAELLAPATLVAGLENTAEKWQADPSPQRGSTQSLWFDGRDDHLVLGDVTDLALDQGFTVEAWVKLANPQEDVLLPVLGSLPPDAPGTTLFLGFKAGHPYASLDGASYVETAQPLDDPDAQWHHLVWQYIPAQGQETSNLRILVDGQQRAEARDRPPFSGSGNLYIGRGQVVNPGTTTPTPCYFHGNLAEVRVWKTIRTDEELKVQSDRPLAGDTSTLAALVAYWIFDEAVTTLIPSRVIGPDRQRYDLVMHSDASLDQPQWQMGPHPIWLNPLSTAALSFDGERQHLATTTPLDLPPAFTLEAWVRVTDWVAERPIVQWGTPDRSQGFDVKITPEGKVAVQSWPASTPTSPLTTTTPDAIAPNTFTHIALVVSPSANPPTVTITLFVNGAVQVTQAVPDFVGLQVLPLTVGMGNTTADPTYFKGLIQEVRLWQRDRTPTEITDSLYHPLSDQETELFGYWPLTEVEVGPNNEKTTPNQVPNQPALRLGGLPGSRKPSPGTPTDFWDRRHRVLTLPLAQTTDMKLRVPAIAAASAQHRAQRTIEVWFLCRNLTTREKQVIYAEGDTDRGLSIHIQNGALVVAGWNKPVEESGWLGSTISTDRLQANRWHHVALVLNGKNELRDHSLRALLDGQGIDTRPGSQLWGHSQAITVGGLTFTPLAQASTVPATVSQSLDGQIRSVRVWEAARTDQQIRDRLYDLPAGDRANLLFYWETTNLTEPLVVPMQLPDPIEAAISDPTLPLVDLAHLRRLQAEWEHPIEQLCALWVDLRHIGQNDGHTLFDRVFNSAGSDPYWAFGQRLTWHLTSDEPDQRQIHTRLLSTLRVSQADLLVLVQALSGSQTVTLILDGVYLTRLYRLKLLSSALGLSASDLVGLIALLQDETATSRHPLHDLANFTLDDVLLLKERADWMQATDITLAEYQFLVHNQPSPAVQVPYTEAMLIDTATTVLNECPDFLLGKRSLASESLTISEAASEAIYQVLINQNVIDEITLSLPTPAGQPNTVTLGVIAPAVLNYQSGDPHVMELMKAIREDVARTMGWATSFDGPELGMSKAELISQGIIESTGLVLKPLPDPTPDQVLLRDLLLNRLDLQTAIPAGVITRLQEQRRSFEAALLNAFASLLDTDADRLLETMKTTQGKLYGKGTLDIYNVLRELNDIVLDIVKRDEASSLDLDLRQLHKILLLLEQFNLSELEMQILLTQSQAVFGIHPENLFQPTLADLQRLYAFEQLKLAFADNQDGLVSVLQRSTPLHEFTGWAQPDILKLADYLHIPPGTYHTIAALEPLHRAFTLLEQLGTDPTDLNTLADARHLQHDTAQNRATSFATYQRHAATLFDLVRAQFSEDQWPQVYRPLHNRLAELKRDGLTAIILEKLGDALGDRKDPNMLYEYLLLDVQTGSAVETSRIVQGIASLQLYVQRCLMNLEYDVNPEQIPLHEWEWMKNYRVWEANRKVFLYPENYIEPDLRDTKTPLFQELQDSLQQGNITAETVRDAYTRYLNQFAEIANLTIVGSYYNTTAAPRTSSALTFDKTFVQVSSIADIKVLIPHHFTLELWVKSTMPPSSWGGIMSAYNWQFQNIRRQGWILEVSEARFRFHLSTADTHETFRSLEVDFVPEQWYHLAVTYDGASIKLYLDGDEKDSASCTGAINYPDNLPDEQQDQLGFVLGSRRDLEVEWNFTGEMREIRIWNTARTQDQIRQNMVNEIKDAGELPQDEQLYLMRCWNRHEDQTEQNDQIIKDFSGNREDLAISNNNRISWHKTPLVDALYQGDLDESSTLYLVGRNETTQEYYTRELINQRQWTPWKKIGITINAPFVSPVFAFGRLFLFWADIQDHIRSEPRKWVANNASGKPVDQLGQEFVLQVMTSHKLPTGESLLGADLDRTNGGILNYNPSSRAFEFSNKLNAVEFINLPLYKPVLKFSFYDFNREWTEPQMVNLPSGSLHNKELSEWERLQPNWLRVYAQRWRGSDVAPLTQKSPELLTNIRVTQLGKDTQAGANSFLQLQVPSFSMREITFSFWLRVERLQAETSTLKQSPRTDTFTLLKYENTPDDLIQLILTHTPEQIGKAVQLAQAVEQSEATVNLVGSNLNAITNFLNDRSQSNRLSLETQKSVLITYRDSSVNNALRAIQNTGTAQLTLLTEVVQWINSTLAAIAAAEALHDPAAADIRAKTATLAERVAAVAGKTSEVAVAAAVVAKNNSSLAPINTNRDGALSEAGKARTNANSTATPLPDVNLPTRNALTHAIAALNDTNGLGKILTDAVNEEAKTEKWSRGEPKLLLGLGTATPQEIAFKIPKGQWLHTTLWLSYSPQRDTANATIKIYAYDNAAKTGAYLTFPNPQDSNATTETQVFTSIVADVPAPGQTLAIGDSNNPLSRWDPALAASPIENGQFQPQLSEFHLWDTYQTEADLSKGRFERKHGREPGLQVHLPLDTEQFGDFALKTDRSSLLELKQTFPPEVAESDRERIVLFYGDQAYTLANTLKDTGFFYTLKANSFALDSYGLSLGLQANEGIGLVLQNNQARIHAEKYVANSLITLDRFSPENRQAVLRSIPTSNKPEILTNAENRWRTNVGTDDILLVNDGGVQLDIASSYIADVYNQPGWCILDVGDQIFLVKTNVDRKRFMTAEERLRSKALTQQAGDGTGQAFELIYDRDRNLEVRPGVLPKFEFIRLNTFAVHNLNERLLGDGIPGLLSLDSQNEQEPDFSKLASDGKLFNPGKPSNGTNASTNQIIAPRYNPDGSLDHRIDFDGAYGLYYREIFFHIPLLIANQLSADQRFAEAQEWYHYIFNPTAQEHALSAAAKTKDRYWRFRGFRGLSLETISQLLSNETALDAYREDPFDPHAIAALRINTYQKTVVMKYIKNLIDWGDFLFRQDTRESITEATQIYVLAYTLLGQRPTSKTAPTPEQIGSYRDIEADLGKALTNPIPPDFLVPTLNAANGHQPVAATPFDPNRTVTTRFGVPANDYFIGFWDEVDDRLFKIRNSLNIDGVFRSLSLFEPPIDPAALVRAAAGGNLSSGISAAASTNGAFTPHYRYSVMIDQAKAFTDLVTDFGGALLDALNNRDEAALAQLERTHAKTLLLQSTDLKQWAIQEAESNRNELNFTKSDAEHKRDFLKGLMDRTKPFGMSGMEVTMMTLKSVQAAMKKVVTIKTGIAAAAATVVVEVEGGGMGVGGSPAATVKTSGGKVAKPLEYAANVFEHLEDVVGHTADILEKLATYEQRFKEWERDHKSLVEYELKQIDEQIKRSDLAKQVAQRELNNHLLEIAQHDEVAEFHRRKFANQDLYSWMANRLSTLYFEAYKLAYDLAKQAERAFQFEFGTNDSFINFSYWDNRRRGLMAGEALKLDLARLEKTALDRDSRYMEITKTISLSRINPIAFLQLKETGVCQFSLDELLFDRDFPGHYFRFIKSLSISIPAVVGPYQSVHAMLTQTGHKTLLEPDIEGVKYLMGLTTDRPASVRVNWRANQSIAVSTAIEDSGVFELDFNDDRYLPFEGTGVVSNWRLEVPKDTNYFDYDTITDVIIHLRYMCNADSGSFREEVRALDEFKTYRSARLFNVTQEFSAQWHAFVTTDDDTLRLPIPPNTFPPNVTLSPLGDDAIAAIYGITQDAQVKTNLKQEFAPSIIPSDTQPTTYTMVLKAGSLKAELALLMIVLTYEGKIA